MKFHTKLKMQMIGAEKSRDEVAAEMNVSMSTMGRWCRGESIPTVNDVVRLSIILSCSPMDLLPDPDDLEEEQAA